MRSEATGRCSLILAALMFVFVLLPSKTTAQQTNTPDSPKASEVPDAKDAVQLLNEALPEPDAEQVEQAGALMKKYETALNGFAEKLTQTDGLERVMAATAESGKMAVRKGISGDLWNLFIGMVGSLLAAGIILFFEHYPKRWRLMRRVTQIQGVYRNTSIPLGSADRITIKHVGRRRFRIEAKAGPTGSWEGSFVLNEDDDRYGFGTYVYPNGAWGTHEYRFDSTSNRISMYGTNKNTAGEISPFHCVLEKQ